MPTGHRLSGVENRQALRFGNLVLPLYNQLMKITTKTGDYGETSLFGGRRVRKSCGIIELVGELDELQAVVGWCKVEAEIGTRNSGRVDGENLQNGGLSSRKVSPVKLFDKIQNDIYRMMSIVGFGMKCPKNIKPIDEKDVKFLENEMAKYEEVVRASGGLNKFVRPGGSEISARLHIARTVCRRVERRVVGFVDGGDFNIDVRGLLRKILKYLNRLSDLLFVLAYVRITA